MPLRHLDGNAKTVVDLANDIAHEHGLEYVSTEHILLALLRHNAGLGARVLERLGVSEQKARKAIDQIVERSKEDTWVFGRLPGSPHYRKVIEIAIDEANQLESRQIGTEHLLLALLREKHTTAQQALTLLGLTLPRCREEILRELHAREAGTPE